MLWKSEGRKFTHWWKQRQERLSDQWMSLKLKENSPCKTFLKKLLAKFSKTSGITWRMNIGPLLLRFIFQFRLSFVLKSSTWMTVSQGVQLLCQRAGLPSRGTRTGQQEPHEIQQGLMESPAPGEDKPPAARHRLGTPWMGSSSAKRAQGCSRTWASRAAKTANSLPGCIKKITDSRLREAISPLFTQHLLDYWTQSGTPSTRKTSFNWRGLRGGHQAGQGRSTCPVRRGCGIGVCSAREGMAWGDLTAAPST